MIFTNFSLFLKNGTDSPIASYDSKNVVRISLTHYKSTLVAKIIMINGLVDLEDCMNVNSNDKKNHIPSILSDIFRYHSFE